MKRFSVRYIGTGSKGNSCLIKVGNTSVLIDAGINPKDFPDDIVISDIDAVFISHSHKDHSKYAFLLAHKYQIDVYASDYTLKECKIPSHLANRIYSTVFLPDITVTSFEVPHDGEEECYAFYMRNDNTQRTLLFIPESGVLPYIPDGNVDFVAIEANYDKESIRATLSAERIPISLYERITGPFGHLDIEDTIRYLDMLGNYHVALLHNMSGQNLNRSIPLPPKAQFVTVLKEYIL